MPSWTKDPSRAVPLVVVLAILAALSIIKPNRPAPTAFDDPATVGIDESSPAPGESPTGGASADPSSTGGPDGSTPAPDGSTPDGLGSTGKPVSGGSNRLRGGATYQGVTPTTVKMGFTWQHAQCGNFFGPTIAAAYGVPQPEEEESIRASIEYFEKFPHIAFPGMDPEMAKGVNARNGYWGRRIVPVFEDNGGPFCADKARATSVKLAEQDKVFGTVQIPNDGSNEFMAPEMAARRLVNIGAPAFTRADYAKWEPYVYDVTFSGTDVVEAWGTYACRDLVRKTTIDTGDPLTANKPRSIGVLYPDKPLYRTLMNQALAKLRACGSGFTDAIAYPISIDSQAAAASNAVAQFRSKGVTSVFMLTDPLFTAQMTTAASGSAWAPEWIVSSVGFNDVAFVVQHFYDDVQRRNVFGASHLSASTAPKWNENDAYKAYKRVRPNREPPGDWNNWYLNISILYAGMAGAGPDLTPRTLLQGLTAVCHPCARDSLRDVGLGFGPGDTTGVDDFTIVKFNVNKPNEHDPGDGSGRQAIGDWDFPEGGKRYLRYITRPLE